MRLVLMGPPGAGKGTQSVVLAEKFAAPHISTGDMFRAAAAAGTELGKRAREYMDAGKLVPDDITMGIVKGRLSASDVIANGFILDGFPRTVPQARGLAEILASVGTLLDRVVLIDVPDDELVSRAAGRLVCEKCGSSYHTQFNPAPDSGCPCGGTLRRRDDDSPKTVRKRLETYRTQTEPLRDYYASEGLLVVVDGRGSLEEVSERIVCALGRCKG